MLDNVGDNGGSIAIMLLYTALKSTIEIISNCKFERGRAYKGAGMMITVVGLLKDKNYLQLQVYS